MIIQLDDSPPNVIFFVPESSADTEVAPDTSAELDLAFSPLADEVGSADESDPPSKLEAAVAIKGPMCPHFLAAKSR